MEYQSQAVPVLTATDLAIALLAGAEIQFTTFLDDCVEDPACGWDSGGWIVPSGNPAGWAGLLACGKLRAFYPVQAPHARYMAASAALRDEE